MQRHLSLLLLGLLGSSAFAGPYEDIFYKGKGTALYGKDRTTEQQRLLDSLKQGHLAEQLASLVSQTVRLRRNLVVGITSCGRVKAFYERSHSRITLCLELVELLAKQVHEGSMYHWLYRAR